MVGAILIAVAVSSLHLTSASGDIVEVDYSPDVSSVDATAEAQRMADFIRLDLCGRDPDPCPSGAPLHISVSLAKQYCLADVALRYWYRCDSIGRPFRDDHPDDLEIIEPARR